MLVWAIRRFTLDEALAEQGDTLAAQFGSQYDLRPVWGYIEKAIAAAKRSPRAPAKSPPSGRAVASRSGQTAPCHPTCWPRSHIDDARDCPSTAPHWLTA